MTFIKRLTMQGFKSFAKKTEIPLSDALNVVLGANGAGKCLTGDSLVQLGDGTVERIDSIVNKRIDKAVKTEDGFLISGDGEEAMCLDFENLKTSKKLIKAFVKRTSPKKLLEIKTRHGREIKMTKYHPLFILRNGEVIAAKAEELKKGVRIAVPRKISFEPENKYFAEILDKIDENDRIYSSYREEYSLILNSIKGSLTWKQLSQKIGISYYALKGLLDKQSINLFYLVKILRFAGLSDVEIVKLCDELISNGEKTRFPFENSEEFARFFGYLLAEGRLAESSHIWFTNGDSEIVEDYVSLVKKLFNKEPLVREYKPNCWDVIIFSEPLKKILNKLGMASKTEQKEISNIFLKHSSNKEISALLNGLYCGDGYISNHSIEIVTKSDSLAKGIGTCLMRLGITFHEKEIVKRIKEINFSGRYKSIISYGVGNFLIFHENISLVHKGKNGRVLQYLSKKGNPNLDLIEANDLVRHIAKELSINVKQTKKKYPLFDSYYYNQCTPSRNGLQLLTKELFKTETESVNKLGLLANSDILWDEITEISEIDGEEWVYDLCVEKDHNFIANNFIAHNSNITDAICFVLGRLSAKSMRAARASNLIYNGGKHNSPSSEAFVELMLDNSEKTFSIEKPEVSISRTVRKNGISIYKVNGETKTRQEILELLAQGGIDPNGFNIILQQEISNFVEMHPEERRQVIEEVAGISIYEDRKKKSLNELNRTDEKLKEIKTILNERGAYLRNLDKERSQALSHESLRKGIERDKAALLFRQLEEKKKESEDIEKNISEKEHSIAKIRGAISGMETKISYMVSEIDSINKHIEQATGVEQEKLHEEVAQQKAEVAVLGVKLESLNSQLAESEKRKEQLEKDMARGLDEIGRLKASLPKDDLKKLLQSKNTSLSSLEEKKERLDRLRTDLIKVASDLHHNRNNFSYLVQKAGQLNGQITDLEKQPRESAKLEPVLEKIKKSILDLEKCEKDKMLSSNNIAESNREIELIEKLKKDIKELDICPVCKRKVTAEHIREVHSGSDSGIKNLQKKLENSIKAHSDADGRIKALKKDIEMLNETTARLKVLKVRENHLNEKKREKEIIEEEVRALESNISSLEKKAAGLEVEIKRFGDFEKAYNQMREEFKELTKKNDSISHIQLKILSTEQEIERIRAIIKKHPAEKKALEEAIKELGQQLKGKKAEMEDKEKKEKEIYNSFQKLFKKRGSVQDTLRELEQKNVEHKLKLRSIEDESNLMKIAKAKTSAELETLVSEFDHYKHLDIESLKLKQSKNEIEVRIRRNEAEMIRIGSVNLRALEVYDKVKEEYEKINDKVMKLEQEKQEILNVIAEIDRKKRITFMKIFDNINSLFSNNFLRLGGKESFLSLESKENPFEGGINIDVKLAKGKYLDVNSLSGGERTLVALSLIFAIQELKPYHFYIFDEIDAALDKRNTERLSDLLKTYIKNAQYIVITHNDSLISDAPILFGVSMQEGVSKVLSLRV